MKSLNLLGVALAVALGATPALAGPTLDKIKAAGVVTCGVSTGLAGFSMSDQQGNYTGLDVDTCRALAAAVLGDAKKAKFVPTSAQQRFTALQSGEIDILTRNTTETLAREADLGFNFAPVTFYDGQGFMVAKKLNVKSAKELNGATVCVQPGTTTELNLADYFRTNKMQMKPLVIEKLDEVENAFFAGRCDAYTTDRSGLAATRISKAPSPDDYVVLPEVISKEPLGPMVRHGDDQWFDIVKWTLYAMVDAEELGVTQKNVDEMAKSDKPELKRAFGTDGNLGEQLGLTKDWMSRIVKAVGNYGESFDRNVGAGSKLGIARGLNQLWSKGGIQYAPPIR